MPTSTPLSIPDPSYQRSPSSTPRSILPVAPTQHPAQLSVRYHPLTEEPSWGSIDDRSAFPPDPTRPSIRLHHPSEEPDWGTIPTSRASRSTVKAPMRSGFALSSPAELPPSVLNSSSTSAANQASYEEEPVKTFRRGQLLPPPAAAERLPRKPKVRERSRLGLTEEEEEWWFEVDEGVALEGRAEEAMMIGRLGEAVRERMQAGCEGVAEAWRVNRPESLKGRIATAAGKEGWTSFVEKGWCKEGNKVWDELEVMERAEEDVEIRRVGLDREAWKALQDRKVAVVYGDTGVATRYRMKGKATLVREVYVGSSKVPLNRWLQHLSILNRSHSTAKHYELTHKFLDDVLSIEGRRLVIDEDLVVAARERAKSGRKEDAEMGEKLEAMLRGLETEEKPNYEVAGHVYVLLWAMEKKAMSKQLRRWKILDEDLSMGEKEEARHALLELVEGSILNGRGLVSSEAAEKAAPKLKEWKLREGLKSTNIKNEVEGAWGQKYASWKKTPDANFVPRPPKVIPRPSPATISSDKSFDARSVPAGATTDNSSPPSPPPKRPEVKAPSHGSKSRNAPAPSSTIESFSHASGSRPSTGSNTASARRRTTTEAERAQRKLKPEAVKIPEGDCAGCGRNFVEINQPSLPSEIEGRRLCSGCSNREKRKRECWVCRKEVLVVKLNAMTEEMGTTLKGREDLEPVVCWLHYQDYPSKAGKRATKAESDVRTIWRNALRKKYRATFTDEGWKEMLADLKRRGASR